MAAGCPIVASAVDGNRELIEDGIHGWLVMPDNVGALATAIQDALHDPAVAQRRGLAAQQRATTQFSCEAMVVAWEQVLSTRS
jgi:glycosyltransferase involved in cell wall biosynthesis